MLKTQKSQEWLRCKHLCNQMSWFVLHRYSSMGLKEPSPAHLVRVPGLSNQEYILIYNFYHGITGIPLIFKGYWYGLPPLLRPKFGKLSTPGRSFKQPTLDLNTSHVRDHSSFENPVWKTLPTPDHFYFLITFWTCRTVLDRMSWSTLYYSSSALQCPLNHLHPWQKKGWFWSCLYIPFYGHKVYLTNGRCQ